MGCLGSKNSEEPVRQRVPAEGRPQPAASGPAQQVAIKHPARVGEDNFSLARSPHDARYEERDYFKGLVEHTASNLIDVSQTAEYLSPADAEARRQIYAPLLKTVTADQRLAALFALPEITPGSALSVGDLLDAKAPSAADVAMAAKTAGAVQAAVAGMRVASTGQLVVALPEIKAE